MDLNLKGKNALVCGSSRGIGRAIAIALADLGANITLIARNADKLYEVIQLLKKEHPQDHDFLQADFNDSADLKRKVNSLLLVKPIHILINNTGGPAGGPIIEAKPEAFLQAFHNHIICSQLLTTSVVKSMKKEGYGRIINIISTSVKAPLDNLGVSNTTRGAMASWGKTMANELGVHGITVNNVLPGFTRTERLEEVIAYNAKQQGVSIEDMTERLQQSPPLKRFGNPSEIANAVAFLASPAASYITGINMPVDGGRTRAM